MTREEAKKILYVIDKRYCTLTPDERKAIAMAIQALENIGHLKDRPCSVCEFRKENGCCKWDCVFKGV